MNTLKKRIVFSSLKEYFARNKKILIAAFIVVTLAIIVGVISSIRAVNGDFERVARVDMKFAGAKIFFLSSLILLISYALFLVAGINNKTAFIAVIPFFILGFIIGKYATCLIARYEFWGILNLLCCYLPFFIATIVLFAIAAVNVLTACQSRTTENGLKPYLLPTLKLFGINVAIGLVLFVIIGSIFGVIEISLF